jgi:branched-chain amino acid transport system substrate-binding protein
MMKAARYLSLLALLASPAWVAGCGSSAPAKPPGHTLTVYMSLPARGVSAQMAGDVASGARLALSDAGGHVDGRRVRLVQLDSSKPGDETWDPSAVQANAKQAANDPDAIAYIGELDAGASAISVPVTNDAGILQVSPADGLTSLTHDEPGTPLTNGPERYYPSGRRSFLRLVPDEYDQAASLAAWARARGARRIALVQDERLFGRELATQTGYLAAKLGDPAVDLEEAHDDPTTYPTLARRLAQKAPDAVVYTGLGDSASGALLGAIHRALPDVPLFAGSALATAAPLPAGLPAMSVLKPALPVSDYGPRAQRLIDRLARRAGSPPGPEALYGYEAMRIVLDSIRSAGKDPDRAGVLRAAMARRERRSAIGPYRVLGQGDVSTDRFGGYRLAAGSLRFAGVRRPPPQALNLP